MALAIRRLLCRRRLLPPPLAAAVVHLSAASQSPTDQHHHHHYHTPLPVPTLPLSPRAQSPFAVHTRGFSWYSGSGSTSDSSNSTTAGEDPGGGSYTEKESAYLDGVHIVDDGEVAASASGAAANAMGEASASVTTEGFGGFTGLATSTVVDLFDGIHSLTGLPWWLTISFSTVAMRLLLLPVLTIQLQKTAKIGEILQKLYPQLASRIASPLPGSSFRDEYALFQKKKKELGCPSILWNFAYFSVQFPCFILWMMSIRSMCLSNHPGFDNGGILWFHNLTEFPHGALSPVFAVSVAGLHYLNVQISFQGSQIKRDAGIFGLLAKYYKMYLDIISIPLFLITFAVPQGCLVYWTTNGLFSVAQQLSLRNDAIRKMLGLPNTRALDGSKMMQRPSLQGANMQTESSSSNNGTGNENTTPNLILESSNIMEGNISESSSPEELLEQALQYLGTGFRDQAIPLIRTAVEKNPDLTTALIGMGQTMFSNRLFPEASECFEHAIPKIQEDDPLLVLAYFGAGISRERQGDNEEAIKLLQRIAELKEPEKLINKACYFKGMLLLGSILSGEGRNCEAAKYLRIAVAYDPSVERFLKECEEAIEDQPKSAEH